MTLKTQLMTQFDLQTKILTQFDFLNQNFDTI